MSLCARILPPLVLAMFVAAPSFGVTIYVEDWNTDGADARYEVIGGGTGAGGTDAWSLESEASPWSFAGTEGADFWLGRDLNGGFGGAASPRVVDVAALSPVDLSGYGGIQVSLLLGAEDRVWESVESDFLRIIAYDTVTDVSQLLDEFRGAAAVNTNMVGSNSGVALGLEMQDLTYDVTAPITNLAIRIEAYSNGGGEVIAFDHLRVSATAVVPEPATVSLLGLGLLGVIVSRRKRSL